jgi:hypothetical protein
LAGLVTGLEEKLKINTEVSLLYLFLNKKGNLFTFLMFVIKETAKWVRGGRVILHI